MASAENNEKQKNIKFALINITLAGPGMGVGEVQNIFLVYLHIYSLSFSINLQLYM